METYDAIIIGGSVSGSPTAMLLARQGHKVLLIDRATFPRDTNSTHFIWPRGMSYLNRWGLADDILKMAPSYRNMEVNIEGISLEGAVSLDALKKRFTQLHGDDQGVIDKYCGPRRHTLDSYLLSAARGAGVTVKEACLFKEVIKEREQIVGIRYEKDNEEIIEAKAKIVIGADGRFSHFVKEVESEYKDYRKLSSFAYYGYFSGIDKEELAIHKKGRFGTAIYPTADNTQMVLAYGPTAWWKEFKVNAEKNFFEIFDYCAPEIAGLIKNATRTEPFKACGSMHAFQRENNGPGWVLVGDAGSFKDQITAMGITHSFRDAELLSAHLHQAFTGKMTIQDAVNQYTRIRKDDYESYFDLVCHVAEMNPYTKDELKYFYDLKGQQDSINAFISVFGDTEFIAPESQEPSPTISTYPSFIEEYDQNDYPQGFPLNKEIEDTPLEEYV